MPVRSVDGTAVHGIGRFEGNPRGHAMTWTGEKSEKRQSVLPAGQYALPGDNEKGPPFRVALV